MKVESCVVMIILSVLGIWDFKSRKLPIGWLGLLGLCSIVDGGMTIYRSCILQGDVVSSVRNIVLGCMIGMGIILIQKGCPRQIGSGDGIVIGFIGMGEGYQMCLKVLICAVGMSFLTALILLTCRIGTRETRLPFVSFLAISLWMLQWRR